MSRSRLLVLAGVALALIVVGPLLALLFADAVRAPESSEAATLWPAANETDATERIVLDEIAWVYAPPPNAGERVRAYGLQAGTLGADTPLLDAEVHWEADLGSDLTRLPPVVGPVAGSVLYVADDGTESVVRRMSIARDGEDAVLARLDDVIWAITASDDGSALFAALVDRDDTGRDLGVVRVELDGSATVEPFMPPAALPRADINRVAFIGFKVQLAVSDDGRHLVRRACRGSEGCVVEVVRTEDGIARDLPDAELIGLAAGVVVQRQCLEAGCRLVATDPETGDSIVVGGDLVGKVVEHRGVPMLVISEPDGDGRSRIVGIDLATGRRQMLYRTVPGSFVNVDVHSSLTLAIPTGFLHVTESTPLEEPQGAVVEMRLRELLVSLDDLAVVEIPPIPFRPPPGFDVQG